jgi:hypothetical protein
MARAAAGREAWELDERRGRAWAKKLTKQERADFIAQLASNDFDWRDWFYYRDARSKEPSSTFLRAALDECEEIEAHAS